MVPYTKYPLMKVLRDPHYFTDQMCKLNRNTKIEEMDGKLLRLSSLFEIFAGTAVSAASFPFALGVIQNFVFKPLRITCKNPIGTFVFGGSSVIVSGTFASCTFLASCAAIQNLRSNVAANSAGYKLDLEITNKDMLLGGIASLVLFRCLGGRTRYTIPSHLFHPGAYARMSIPASGRNYANSSSKKTLNTIGRKYGCHSCGTRRQKDFVADHIPPNKLVKFYQFQVFYPQCKSCSQKQGGALASDSRHAIVQTHATTLRKYHIWLPIPLGIAVFRNVMESGI